MSQAAAPIDPTALVDGMSLQIVVPADPRLLRVLRLVTSGLASLGRFDLDSVEEARVAVDELGSALMRAGGGGPVTLDFELDDQALRVDGSTELAGSGPLTIDPLTERILRAVATTHDCTTDDGVGHLRLEKHLSLDTASEP